MSSILKARVAAVAVAGIAALFMLAMRVSSLSAALDSDGYAIKAHFENISGLKERSNVTMAGVNIGRVTDIGFDPESFQAVVTMQINHKYNNLPNDTSASILTAGLLGEKYVEPEVDGGGDVPAVGPWIHGLFSGGSGVEAGGVGIR